MSRRRLAGVLLLGALAGLLTGCWDFRDINERALVLLLGIDRSGAQRYRVTVQIPLPPGPNTEPSSQGRFRIIEGEGASVEAALEHIRVAVFRELEMGQTKVIILGPAVAAEGLQQLDWLGHSRRLPPIAFIAIARESAAAVVRARTPAIAIPALYLYHQYDLSHNRDDSIVPMRRWQLMSRLYSNLEDAYAPGVTAQKYGVNTAGMALFRQGRLVGWLDERGASTFTRVYSGRFDGEETVSQPGGRALAARLTRGSRRLGVRLDPDGGIVLLVDLRTEASLRQDSALSRQAAEAELGQHLAGQAERLLRQLQDLGSDPLGFGERLRRLAPSHPAVASPAAWRRAFRRARIEVVVRVQIRSVGYLRTEGGES